jgi:2-dehydro-3-deoxyphosphogalactonate aldolase
MTPSDALKARLRECPLVAIIRGVTPGEAEATGATLFEAGFRIIEVPLNSPEPLDSIARLARMLGEEALIGAGTVLDAQGVARVRDAGGRLIVSPNTDLDVIRASVEAGLVSMPGFFTPSEAFAALDAGAHGLKFFPAEAATPAVIRAQRAVLPADVPLLVVGGITPDGMEKWTEAGADGFGLGSALYRPGQSVADTKANARAFVAALAR